MADNKVQKTSEPQREQGVARRQDYYPSRDLFSFSPFSMMRRLSEEMDRAFGSSFGLSRGFPNRACGRRRRGARAQWQSRDHTPNFPA